MLTKSGPLGTRIRCLPPIEQVGLLTRLKLEKIMVEDVSFPLPLVIRFSTRSYPERNFGRSQRLQMDRLVRRHYTVPKFNDRFARQNRRGPPPV